jgi:hypothetical protein
VLPLKLRKILRVCASETGENQSTVPHKGLTNTSPLNLSVPCVTSGPPAQDHLLARFPKWTLSHWCVTVAAVSFLILALLPEGRLNDFDISNGAENVRVARSLASHRTFADPFAALPTGTTAHVPPIYPLLYAAFLRTLGTGYPALLSLWAVNVAFFAAQMGLLPLLSHRMGFGILPGIVAAFLGTLSLYSPIDTRWECFFTGLLLMLAFLATERSLTSKSFRGTLAAGALWGILILTNPVLILLMLFWPLVWIFARPQNLRAVSWRGFATLSVVALLVISPWIARNCLRFGAFIFVRDNLGLELYTSNNSCAAPSIRENIQSGCHFRTHPNSNPAVAAQLVTVGELRFNRMDLRQALSWMGSHPSAFLNLTARRFRLFWFPTLDRTAETVFVWLITLLSVPGLWFMARHNRTIALLIVIAWLVFPAIYYLVQFEPRYRYPIYWTSLIPAGYAFTQIWRRIARSRSSHSPVF